MRGKQRAAVLEPQHHLLRRHAGGVEPAWKDENCNEPDLFRKPTQGIEPRRVQFLPVKTERRPRRFWQKDKCLYELGAGEYQGAPGWRVRFMMAGNQAVCNGGRYN